MAIALESVVKQLQDSGIIAPGKLENFVPPKALPKDAEELLRALHKQNLLTKFQAQQVAAGRAKSLILGGYTILDKIGAGGMGQVFKAEHRRMHRLVAIKMLPNSMMKDAAAIARFEREVTAAAKLRHPNIVAADDAAEANGVHFLVMEYVDGQDLSALVKNNGPFPVAKAVNFTLQAARGLEFAHSEGIVHRDIKPANLLIDKKGTVKILDMGLARIASAGDAATQAELTGTGAIMGTVDYMAPEQALSTKHADARADIYSLGCSLYYLIAGKPAYDGETLMGKMLAHRENPIPSLRDLHIDISEELEAVFNKMVAKRIDDRYQTMGEVVADLEKCSAGQSSSLSQSTSLNMQQSVSTNADESAPSFLKTFEITPTIQKSKATKKVAAAKSDAKPSGKPPLWKNAKVLIGAAAAVGAMIVAGIIVSLKTKDGTIIVEIDQPDAMVQVLDAEGKVEVSQKGGAGKVTIGVDPGKHRLKVEKDGFTVFGEEFEIKSGEKQTITAKLERTTPKIAASKKVDPETPSTTPARPLTDFNSPAFKQWMKDVAEMSAEKQVEAVSKKLVELNPGFDGKVTPIIDDGVGSLDFVTEHVTDISPVRALTQLKILRCEKGKLSDLSPLQGMPLTLLAIGATRVSDLTPLKGMPLTHFLCQYTLVTDLSPVAGMDLTYLDCFATKVSDLSPLKNTKLTDLIMAGTVVADLSSIKTLPLAYLHMANSSVTDLSPLQGMQSLKQLILHSTLVTDLAPLKGLQLEYLEFGGTPVSDISPLRGMPLTDLHMSITDGKITDYTPIRDMPLKNLHIDFKPFRDTELLRSIKTLDKVNEKPIAEFWKEADKKQAAFNQWMKDVAGMAAEKQVEAVSKKLMELNPGFDGKLPGIDIKGEPPRIEDGVVTGLQIFTDDITDISPVRALAGLKLLIANVSGSKKSKLSDLSPLKGLPLNFLNIQSTEVQDLSPLKGMKLTQLFCSGANVLDLSPLKSMPLEHLALEGAKVVSLSPLEGMPLSDLNLAHAPINDLAPLKGSSLKRLVVSYTQVADLSPLKDMKLLGLWCFGTKVTDLSPLSGMPLTHLHTHDSQVTDLSPLAGMKLESLTLSPQNIVKGINIIRQMQTLKTIGTDWDAQHEWPAEQFWKKYDAGDFGKPTPPAKPLTDINSPAFKQWMKDVAAMPADKQVKAVAKKLQDLNPGFDGKLTPMIAGGVVTTVAFFTNNVTDISPVRALTGLQSLSFNEGKLSDLSPLQEMTLSRLSITATQVSDLTPLKGMPLEYLDCERTLVADLSPVAGKTLKHLACGGTKVSDLSPLKNTKLLRLGLESTLVKDLSPLKGLPLDYFSCGQTAVSDLSALKGMPLRSLHLGSCTQVSDLSPIKGMPLEELVAHGTRISDLSPIKDMPLKALFVDFKPFRDAELLRSIKTLESISGKPAAEFWKEAEKQRAAFQQWMKDVAAMPAEEQVEAVSKKLVELNPGFDGKVTPLIQEGKVTNFDVRTENITDISSVRALRSLKALSVGNRGGTRAGQVSDLSPIAGMPLANLYFYRTQVSDLSPLKGMKLTVLECYGSPVADLSPLAGMPLNELHIGVTKVTDLSPIKGMKLTVLHWSNRPPSDLSPIRSMPLKDVHFELVDPVRDIEILRSIKTLELINGKKPAEFFKEQEAKSK